MVFSCQKCYRTICIEPFTMYAVYLNQHGGHTLLVECDYDQLTQIFDSAQFEKPAEEISFEESLPSDCIDLNIKVNMDPSNKK